MDAEELTRHAAGLARLLMEERRLRQRADERSRNATFLADTSRVLAAGIDDYAGLVSSLARLAVPHLADWCLVRLTRDGREATVAIAHASPDREALLAPLDLGSLDAPAPADPGRSTLLVAGAADCARLFVDRFRLAGERRDRTLDAVRAAGMASFLVVPLVARGRVLGAVILVAADPARAYDDELVAVAEAFAARAALAIDNARMYRDAQRAARTRDDFLMVASHELRTPLASLQIAVQALLRRTSAVDERLPIWSVPLLRAVERSVMRLGALVDDLLDFSYLAAGPPVPLAQEVDLRDVVNEVVEHSSDLLHRARCEVRFSSSGPADGSWDRRWLVQIVTHLLSNAAKHGRGTPIELELEGDDRIVTLTVRDHGAGIAADDQDRIFERLERAAPSEYGGLGLGLWLVRRMVDGLGGRVVVRSVPGDGAAFTVALPRRRASSEARAAS